MTLVRVRAYAHAQVLDRNVRIFSDGDVVSQLPLYLGGECLACRVCVRGHVDRCLHALPHTLKPLSDRCCPPPTQ
jgi:hypothetical protein